MQNYFKLWKKHKFKIIVFVSILLILIFCFKNDRTKGTWSLEYSYTPKPAQSIKVVKDSRGELECRRVMEKLFCRPFPNQRPDFLMNVVTGKPLEIDCCNLELGLGVEYNGRQHYHYTPGMHKNVESFRLQQYRDEMKIKLCKENDFNLIIVPYTIDIQSIENYLIHKLRETGYNV